MICLLVLLPNFVPNIALNKTMMNLVVLQKSIRQSPHRSIECRMNWVGKRLRSPSIVIMVRNVQCMRVDIQYARCPLMWRLWWRVFPTCISITRFRNSFFEVYQLWPWIFMQPLRQLLELQKFSFFVQIEWNNLLYVPRGSIYCDHGEKW